MTRLLVSVRNAEEALAALEGGADLVDIKEPTRGALGAADPHIWQQISMAIDGRVPLSAALGELAEINAGGDLQGLAFVKAGLAGCTKLADWQFRLRKLQQSLPPPTQLAAVIYADYDRAAAPDAMEVLKCAADLGLDTLLIDTFDKTQGDVWSILGEQTLREIVENARRLRMRIALAGSITLDTIPRALELAPDWVAVRGAACEGTRVGRISTRLVAALKAAISQRDAQTKVCC